MSNDHSKKLLRDIELKAALYAEQATRLSDMLEEVVQFLRQIPGKTEVVVEHSMHDKLQFTRKGDQWDLWYGPDDESFGGWVTSLPVSMKAAAAKLLPELFEKLVGEQTANLTEVTEGIEALNNLPLFRDGSRQGAK